MGLYPQAFKKMFHLKSRGALFAALLKGRLRVSGLRQSRSLRGRRYRAGDHGASRQEPRYHGIFLYLDELILWLVHREPTEANGECAIERRAAR